MSDATIPAGPGAAAADAEDERRIILSTVEG